MLVRIEKLNNYIYIINKKWEYVIVKNMAKVVVIK